MTEPPATLAVVRAVLSHYSGVPEADIGLEQSIAAHKEDGGLDLDSLDRIEVAMALEEKFGIDIPPEDVDKAELGTPIGLAVYLAQRRAEAWGYSEGYRPEANAEDGQISAHFDASQGGGGLRRSGAGQWPKRNRFAFQFDSPLSAAGE